jgi:hypothetical protein
MSFRFIEDRRADCPVTILCDVLGISRCAGNLFQKGKVVGRLEEPISFDPLQMGRPAGCLQPIFSRLAYYLRESATVFSNHRKMVAGHGE